MSTLTGLDLLKQAIKGNTQITVYYHDNCLDGFGSAYVIWRTAERIKQGAASKINFVPAKYGMNLPEDACMNQLVFVLDFSFAPAVMHSLSISASQFVWIDHHKSAIEAWMEYEKKLPVPAYSVWAYLGDKENTKSGARLTADFMGHSPLWKLIDHISDRDTWRFENQSTKAFIECLALEERTFKNWYTLDLDSCGMFYYSRMLAKGEALLKQKENLIKEFALNAKIGQYVSARNFDQVFDFAVLTCPKSLVSELGHYILDTMPKVDFFVGICKTSEGELKEYSLRSRRDFNVLAIAESFGGGGHRNAAGFTATSCLFDFT